MELYIKAPNVNAGSLTDFAMNDGLSVIPNQGTIFSINVLVADGWISIEGR